MIRLIAEVHETDIGGCIFCSFLYIGIYQILVGKAWELRGCFALFINGKQKELLRFILMKVTRFETCSDLIFENKVL